MSGPVKFDEKSKNDKLAGNHPYHFLKWLHDDQQAMMTMIGGVVVLDLPFLHIPKSEKFCMSGLVKNDEKSKNNKLAGNHPYYFLKWLHDDQQAMMTLVGGVLVLDLPFLHFPKSGKILHVRICLI